MANKINISPAELLAQAGEMKALGEDFDRLFNSISSELGRVNKSWSTNLSHNFAPKIISAQADFAFISEMLKNGTQIASNSAFTFQTVDNQLSKLFFRTVQQLGRLVSQHSTKRILFLK